MESLPAPPSAPSFPRLPNVVSLPLPSVIESLFVAGLDAVIATAAVEGIVRAAAGDRVVARTAADRSASSYAVVARTAVGMIGAAADDDPVVAVAAVGVIGAIAGKEEIVAPAAVEGIVALAGIEGIGEVAAGQVIIARPGIELQLLDGQESDAAGQYDVDRRKRNVTASEISPRFTAATSTPPPPSRKLDGPPSTTGSMSTRPSLPALPDRWSPWTASIWSAPSPPLSTSKAVSLPKSVNRIMTERVGVGAVAGSMRLSVTQWEWMVSAPVPRSPCRRRGSAPDFIIAVAAVDRIISPWLP